MHPIYMNFGTLLCRGHRGGPTRTASGHQWCVRCMLVHAGVVVVVLYPVALPLLDACRRRLVALTPLDRLSQLSIHHRVYVHTPWDSLTPYSLSLCQCTSWTGGGQSDSSHCDAEFRTTGQLRPLPAQLDDGLQPSIFVFHPAWFAEEVCVRLCASQQPSRQPFSIPTAWVVPCVCEGVGGPRCGVPWKVDLGRSAGVEVGAVQPGCFLPSRRQRQHKARNTLSILRTSTF